VILIYPEISLTHRRARLVMPHSEMEDLIWVHHTKDLRCRYEKNFKRKGSYSQGLRESGLGTVIES
jgi:hypothetical protein